MSLYNEIVWAKIGSYRFWPSIILPTHIIPLNVLRKPHAPNEFCVKFFGSLDYCWLKHNRVYTYQEEDSLQYVKYGSHNRLDVVFKKAVRQANVAFQLLQKQNYVFNIQKTIKPQGYVRIKTNFIANPIKFKSLNSKCMDNEEICNCSISELNPCGYQSGKYAM